MEAVQVQQVIAKDGEIVITGLPYKKGQCVQRVQKTRRQGDQIVEGAGSETEHDIQNP